VPEVIESLTPEQGAQIPVFYEEYLEIGWSTEPADRPAAYAVMSGATAYVDHLDGELANNIRPSNRPADT